MFLLEKTADVILPFPIPEKSVKKEEEGRRGRRERGELAGMNTATDTTASFFLSPLSHFFPSPFPLKDFGLFSPLFLLPQWEGED